MRCYFHSDADGRCAGAIVWRTIARKDTNCEMIEVDYKDEIDIEKIKVGEKIIIVDFSFKPEVMEKVLLLTKDIVWIDHHKTAFEYKYSRKLEGLRDNAYSGCELTWKYFHGEEPMPRAVELIGDRDKWAWKFRSETANFNAGLLLYDHQPKDEIWDKLFRMPIVLKRQGSYFRVDVVPRIIKEGKTCLKFRDQFCNDYARSYGFETVFEGYKCFALGLYMFGREAFGDRIKEYDICLSFAYLGDNWIVGLYSETVDVSKIAQKYAGGGHKSAAGLVCKTLPFKKRKD